MPSLILLLCSGIEIKDEAVFLVFAPRMAFNINALLQIDSFDHLLDCQSVNSVFS